MTKPHDHQDNWDDADKETLERLLKYQRTFPDEYTYEYIGRQLGRTKDAVRSKARRMGLR